MVGTATVLLLWYDPLEITVQSLLSSGLMMQRGVAQVGVGT